MSAARCSHSLLLLSPVCGGRRGSRPAGRSAPLMSPGVGLRPPPPPLLRYAERPTGLLRSRSWCSTDGKPPLHQPRASGGRRSEVKEEGRAQPGPGDMSGVGHPMALAARNWRRNDRNGAESRLTSKALDENAALLPRRLLRPRPRSRPSMARARRSSRSRRDRRPRHPQPGPPRAAAASRHPCRGRGTGSSPR